MEGLKIALDHIDEVIAILRASKSVSEGKEKLMQAFDLDEIQAQAIVQMRLGQLTGLERSKIEEELAALEQKIAELLSILGDKSKLLNMLKTEILEIKRRFADERRTKVTAVSGEVDIEDLIPEEDCVLTLTNFGYVKRQKTDTYKLQRRGGRGISGMSCREEDVAAEMFVVNSHDYVMFFTNFGKVYRLKCYEIPEGSRVSKGTNVANLLPIMPDEKVTSMIKVPDFDGEKYLVMVTKSGVIKRTLLSAYDSARKGGLIAIDLDDGDELAWVSVTDGATELLVATKKGMAIRFNETDVRAVGRTARGVKAISLRDGDNVVGMSPVSRETMVLTVSETGYGRLSEIDDYRLQMRGGKGITNYHVEKYGDVASIKLVSSDEDIILISESGIIIRIKADTIRVCSRPSKGVRVMKIADNNRIVAVASVPHEDDVEDVSSEDVVEDAAKEDSSDD